LNNLGRGRCRGEGRERFHRLRICASGWKIAVVHLARRVAESGERYRTLASELARREAVLEASRLAREGTLCRESMTDPEGEWLRRARPPEAEHWNLLTSLSHEQLRYAG
jgi:hypothetical protein